MEALEDGAIRLTDSEPSPSKRIRILSYSFMRCAALCVGVVIFVGIESGCGFAGIIDFLLDGVLELRGRVDAGDLPCAAGLTAVRRVPDITRGTQRGWCGWLRGRSQGWLAGRKVNGSERGGRGGGLKRWQRSRLGLRLRHSFRFAVLCALFRLLPPGFALVRLHAHYGNPSSDALEIAGYLARRTLYWSFCPWTLSMVGESVGLNVMLERCVRVLGNVF
jgi:hypothetical protein